jgi:hypothetical protein
MASTSNAASVWVPATASIVPYLFLHGALSAGVPDRIQRARQQTFKGILRHGL